MIEVWFLGVVPIALELATIPLLVFFGNLHQFGVITALFILLIVVSIDKVVGVEPEYILNLMLDDGSIISHDGVDFLLTMLKYSLVL